LFTLPVPDVALGIGPALSSRISVGVGEASSLGEGSFDGPAIALRFVVIVDERIGRDNILVDRLGLREWKVGQGGIDEREGKRFELSRGY
jgi:hypothetical protein